MNRTKIRWIALDWPHLPVDRGL